MPDIVFANSDAPIVPSSAIIHDNESFRVQWSALNISDREVPEFIDRLVVSSIPEGCPGSDDQEHEVVYDSDVDGETADFTEPDLAAGAAGPLMEPMIGPLSAGSYRLTVTLANDSGQGATTFNCIEIVEAT